jgi:hypothetical protein
MTGGVNTIELSGAASGVATVTAAVTLHGHEAIVPPLSSAASPAPPSRAPPELLEPEPEPDPELELELELDPEPELDPELEPVFVPELEPDPELELEPELEELPAPELEAVPLLDGPLPELELDDPLALEPEPAPELDEEPGAESAESPVPASLPQAHATAPMKTPKPIRKARSRHIRHPMLMNAGTEAIGFAFGSRDVKKTALVSRRGLGRTPRSSWDGALSSVPRVPGLHPFAPGLVE